MPEYNTYAFKRIGDRMKNLMKKWLIKLAAALFLWSSTAASAQNIPILNMGFSGAGTFMTNLWAARGKVSTYEIELLDAAGRRCPTRPERFTYSFGASTTDPPLIHSLGIALINNEMEVLIPKGTALPAKKRVVHKTGMVHRKGPGGDPIKIPGPWRRFSPTAAS